MEMRRFGYFSFVKVVWGCLIMLLCLTSLAGANEWRFPVYISYVSGFSKVGDLHKDNSNNQSTYFRYEEQMSWPVGFAFQPYFEFDSGLRFGMGIGPLGAVIGAQEDFYILPVNLTVGFTFLPKSEVSPYVRAGVSYPLANGGYVEGQTPGFLGAFGLEFWRERKGRFGFEIAIDTSTVDFTKYTRTTSGTLLKGTESIRPMDVTGSLFISF
jgi:hypothetical protein